MKNSRAQGAIIPILLACFFYPFSPPKPVWLHENKGNRVVVIGGGVVGCSVAYHTKRLRPESSVILIEKDTIAGAASSHNAGTIGLPQSFSTVRSSWFAPNWEEILAYFSVTTYQSMEQELGLDCELEESGALLVATTEQEQEYVESSFRALCERGYDDISLLMPPQLFQKEPRLERQHVRSALHLPGSVHIHPRSATLAIAQAGRDAGVSLMEGVGVSRISRCHDAQEWQVELTTREKIYCDIVVLACGLESYALEGILRVVPVKGQIVQSSSPLPSQLLHHIIFSASAHAAFQQRTQESFPPKCTTGGEIRHLYGRQMRDGHVIWGGSRVYDSTPKLDYTPDPAVIASIAKHANELVRHDSAVEWNVKNAWSCFMPFSVDGKPFLGQTSQPGLFLALGFGPEGMTHGPGAGFFLALDIWGMNHPYLAPIMEELSPKGRPL